MELDWYGTGAVGMLEGSIIFQETTSEPAGKGKKLTPWHLVPYNKHLDKQGCTCQSHNHKISNPRKCRMVITHPSVSVYVQCISFNCNLLAVICCYLSVTVCHLASCFHSHSFVSAQLLPALFDLIRSIICCLIIQYLFLFWYWNCIPGILIPVLTTIWQINKHHTTILLPS